MRVLAAIIAGWAALSLSAAAVAQQSSGYDAAVAARLDGRPADAAALLRAWLAEHPDDLDAQLHLAYSELALGDLDSAEAGFRKVLAAAPEYEDARQGLALVEARRAGNVLASRPELLVEGALSTLKGPASDWYEAGARLRVPAGRTTYEGAGSYYRRFGTSDVEFSGALVHRADEDLWLRAEASATPDATFRPDWGVGAGFDWRLNRGDHATVLSLDARHQDFPAQKVTTISPGLGQYFAGGRAWATARAFGIVPEGDDLQVGWMLRADVQPRERYRLFAGLADGPDTDLGVVTDVTSVFGGVELPLGERFALTAAVGHEWRDALANRTNFRLGLKFGL